MNRTIKKRKADGECKNKKCSSCEYCFIHPLLGIACGQEYPASFADVCRYESDDYEE